MNYTDRKNVTDFLYLVLHLAHKVASSYSVRFWSQYLELALMCSQRANPRTMLLGLLIWPNYFYQCISHKSFDQQSFQLNRWILKESHKKGTSQSSNDISWKKELNVKIASHCHYGCTPVQQKELRGLGLSFDSIPIDFWQWEMKKISNWQSDNRSVDMIIIFEAKI